MASTIENPWHAVLDDALVCRFLLNEKNVNDPKQALNDIINWEIMVSQDPAVNGADYALDLIRRLSDTLERTQKTVDYEGACSEPTSRKRHALIGEARNYLAQPTSDHLFSVRNLKQ